MLHFTLEKIRVSITGLCAESHGDLPALIGSPLRLGILDHYNNLRPVLISILSCCISTSRIRVGPLQQPAPYSY